MLTKHEWHHASFAVHAMFAFAAMATLTIGAHNVPVSLLVLLFGALTSCILWSLRSQSYMS